MKYAIRMNPPQPYIHKCVNFSSRQNILLVLNECLGHFWCLACTVSGLLSYTRTGSLFLSNWFQHIYYKAAPFTQEPHLFVNQCKSAGLDLPWRIIWSGFSKMEGSCHKRKLLGVVAQAAVPSVWQSSRAAQPHYSTPKIRYNPAAHRRAEPAGVPFPETLGVQKGGCCRNHTPHQSPKSQGGLSTQHLQPVSFCWKICFRSHYSRTSFSGRMKSTYNVPPVNLGYKLLPLSSISCLPNLPKTASYGLTCMQLFIELLSVLHLSTGEL
jgi:hypothetical protein